MHENAGDYEHKTDVGDEKFWAVATLIAAARNEPDLCWVAILRLLSRAETDLQLSNIAAGPLEDLLVQHGHEFISRVERQSVTDPRFRELVSGVWQNAIPEEIWQRVQRIQKESGNEQA